MNPLVVVTKNGVNDLVNGNSTVVPYVQIQTCVDFPEWCDPNSNVAGVTDDTTMDDINALILQYFVNKGYVATTVVPDFPGGQYPKKKTIRSINNL